MEGLPRAKRNNGFLLMAQSVTSVIKVISADVNELLAQTCAAKETSNFRQTSTNHSAHVNVWIHSSNVY